MQFPVEGIVTQKGHKTIHSLLSELCKPLNTSKYQGRFEVFKKKAQEWVCDVKSEQERNLSACTIWGIL